MSGALPPSWGNSYQMLCSTEASYPGSLAVGRIWLLWNELQEAWPGIRATSLPSPWTLRETWALALSGQGTWRARRPCSPADQQQPAHGLTGSRGPGHRYSAAWTAQDKPTQRLMGVTGGTCLVFLLLEHDTECPFVMSLSYSPRIPPGSCVRTEGQASSGGTCGLNPGVPR